jgi:SAM-dependent methyltransferase
MPEKVECNVCHSSEGVLFKKGVFGNPAQDVYQCKACGHVYLAPLLDDQEEARFYLDQYSAFLVSRGDNKSVSPQEHFAGNKDEAERRFKDVAPFLDKGRSVLEIGSSSGFFLARIKDCVGDVAGIEQNAAHKDFANKAGLPTFSGFEEVAGRKFDMIFLYYLLEHIKYPVDFIRMLKTFLKGKASRIVVEVPNVNEALVSLYKSSSYNEFVWQRAHCSYFSVKVLDTILSGLGFRTEFIPLQRYDFSNHLYWLVQGKPGGKGKYAHVFSQEFDAQYRKALCDQWLCDSILLIATLDQKEEK